MTSTLSKGLEKLDKLDFCFPDCRPGVIWFKSLQCHGHHYWWSGCNVWMEIVSASSGQQTYIEHYWQPAARPASRTYETGLTWKLAMQYATCSQGWLAPGAIDDKLLLWATGLICWLFSYKLCCWALEIWSPGNFSWSAHTRSPLVRRGSRDEPLLRIDGCCRNKLHKLVHTKQLFFLSLL